MKPSIIVIRVLETIALVGVVVTYTVTPTTEVLNYSVLAVFCNFSIGSTSDDIVVSSIIVGYALSLLGTALQWNSVVKKLKFWSLGLALLGLAVCLNEIGRYFFGYRSQFFFHAPIVVVLVDWAMMRKSNFVDVSVESDD